LDGILAYSFVKDAPSLTTTTMMKNDDDGLINNTTTKVDDFYDALSSNSNDQMTTTTKTKTKTRRVHSYGKEWSKAANPEYDVVYFDTIPELIKHYVQTGFMMTLRGIQHVLSLLLLVCLPKNNGSNTKKKQS